MKKKIIVILISLFTSITIVNADSINIRQTADGYLLINESANEYQTYIINPSSNATLRIKIATALSESDIYSYMFMDICSTRDIQAVRTSNPGQSCTNSCWSNQVYTEKTNYICTTNAQNGQIYRITTPIQKWEKDLNDEMAYVNDQLTIRNTTSDIISTTIYGVYISNDTNNGTINIDYTDVINNIGNRQITAIDATTSAVNNVAEEARENTQDIMDNQNANSQAQIDSQKVCDYIDRSNIKTDNKYLDSAGREYTSSSYGITDYIKIEKSELKTLDNSTSSTSGYTCFYDINKEKISCIRNNEMGLNQNVTIPTNASYMRASIQKNLNKPTFYICKNGNQGLIDADTNYNNNASEEIQGSQDVEDTTELEESIMEDLDFSGANNINVTINGETSNFIWGIVERLRGINVAIVTLWTSILGLGIIKMILNR